MLLACLLLYGVVCVLNYGVLCGLIGRSNRVQISVSMGSKLRGSIKNNHGLGV